MSCDFSSEDPFSFGGGAATSAASSASSASAASSASSASSASAASAASAASGYISIEELHKKFRFDDTRKPNASGSFGSVYIGENLGTGEPVAVKKVFSRPTTQNPQNSLAKTIKEATTAMLFDSPNLCKVYGFSVDDAGFVYIVMERINGVEAFEYFVEHFNKNIMLGKTNPALIKKILLDIARALAILHAAGYAHCDIKLDNVMLEFDSQGNFVRAVIIDFGFTKRVSDIPIGSRQGTVCYSAPEMIKGLVQLTVKIDIWALGAISFIFLHGYYPIWSSHGDPRAERDDIYQKLLRLTKSPELPIYTEDNQEVNDLRMICARCLEFDPAKRISAEELLAMLPS
jgi:serine/threonine protein kinase